MKKFIAIILTLSLLLTMFSACGNKENTDNVLKVGMDLKFPPFSYIGDDGEAQGFEPIIAKAFGEYLGMEVEIVNTDFSMLIPALDTGAVDILIADMSKTDERAMKADFSDPYRYTSTLALVNKQFAIKNNITNDMKEDNFFSIDGAKFIGLSGTMGVLYPQSKGVDVLEVTEIGTGLLEVSKGISHILVASNEVFGFQKADPQNTIVYAGINNQTASSFAVKKGNTELLQKANEFISSMYDEGGFYDQIRTEYDPIVSDFLQNPELGLDFITMPQQ